MRPSESGADTSPSELVARMGRYAASDEPVLWCGWCGGSLGAPDDARDHTRCVRQPDLEPPRYCVHCKRRMKVQVTPGRWSATCSVHGTVEHSTWA